MNLPSVWTCAGAHPKWPEYIYERSESGQFPDGVGWAIYLDTTWKRQGLKHPYIYAIAIGDMSHLYGMYDLGEARTVVNQLREDHVVDAGDIRI